MSVFPNGIRMVANYLKTLWCLFILNNCLFERDNEGLYIWDNNGVESDRKVRCKTSRVGRTLCRSSDKVVSFHFNITSCTLFYLTYLHIQLHGLTVTPYFS